MQIPLMQFRWFGTLLLACACALMQPFVAVQSQAQAGQTILRVALFPHIPDPAGDALRALEDSIKKRFERANPSITLQMRRMNPRDPGFYSPDSLRAWLQPAVGGGRYDVVEIDAVLLDTLVGSQLIQPWGIQPDANWVPEALPALKHSGALYGIPHWLCSDFLITRDTAVFRATTFADLMLALGLSSSGPSAPRPITGFVRGSWVLPMLYLHAWADTYGPQELDGAMVRGLDSAVVRNMRRLLSHCEIEAINTCLGQESNLDETVSLFAAGKASALIGYSERLTSIIQAGIGSSTLLVSPLPLGPGDGAASFGNQTLLYVDALVLRTGCNDACRDAARKFSTFLLSDSTYQLVLMSRDVTVAPSAPPAIPRYLIPATRSAFQVPGVAGDSLFAQIYRAIPGAVTMPNAGLPGRRAGMQKALLNSLMRPSP